MGGVKEKGKISEWCMIILGKDNGTRKCSLGA